MIAATDAIAASGSLLSTLWGLFAIEIVSVCCAAIVYLAFSGKCVKDVKSAKTVADVANSDQVFEPRSALTATFLSNICTSIRSWVSEAASLCRQCRPSSGSQKALVVAQALSLGTALVGSFVSVFLDFGDTDQDPACVATSFPQRAMACIVIFFAGALMNCEAFFRIPIV
jgi:hypothetical protein